MSSINPHQFAQMFKEVFGASKITKTKAIAEGMDGAKATDDVYINAQNAYEDKDMQEYVIAQYNADLEELDEIPEDEEKIKPTTGEGTEADV